jgi:hypothetical protein
VRIFSTHSVYSSSSMKPDKGEKALNAKVSAGQAGWLGEERTCPTLSSSTSQAPRSESSMVRPPHEATSSAASRASLTTRSSSLPPCGAMRPSDPRAIALEQAGERLWHGLRAPRLTWPVPRRQSGSRGSRPLPCRGSARAVQAMVRTVS